MRRRSKAAARAVALLAAVLACVPMAFAQRVPAHASGVFRYEYEIAPDELVKGGTALLILKIEGMTSSSLRVDALRLGPGLALETQAARPYVMKGGAKGAELRLGFALGESGTRRIETLILSSSEGRLELGPIELNVKDPSGAAKEAAPLPAMWEWKAPASAYRCEAFEVRLERADGGATQKGLSASFQAPAKATIEASGYLEWTVVALEEGKLVLPDATLDPDRGSPGRRGQADAVSVKIKAFPKAISESKAIGRLSMRLDGPDPSSPVAGGSAEFALRLEGAGNFPCIVLPEPIVLLDGAPLDRGAWSSRREDDFRAGGSGYSGSASAVVAVAPPRAGRLRLSFPPLAVLGTDGKVASLEARAIEVEVRAPERPKPAAASAMAVPFGPTTEAARLLWEKDERGAALASLYGTMRRELPFERAYREADAASRAISAVLARERAGESGAGEPLLDALPPPVAFLVPAVVLAASAALVAALGQTRARRRKRRDEREKILAGERARPRARAAAIALLAAALLALALCLASALERRSSYAVVWTDQISVIPSAQAELRIRVPLGATARERGESSGFVGLVLADGVEAWAPSESVFTY